MKTKLFMNFFSSTTLANALLYLSIIIFPLFFVSKKTKAYSYAEMTQVSIKDASTSLRFLNIAANNFFCKNYPNCANKKGNKVIQFNKAEASDSKNTNFIMAYKNIEQLYIQVYKSYYRGQYAVSYKLVSQLQDNITNLLELLSEVYLKRTDLIINNVLLYQDNSKDIKLLEILLYYAPNSSNVREFLRNRELVPYRNKSYNAKDFIKFKNKKDMFVSLKEANEIYHQAKEANTRARKFDKLPLNYEELLQSEEIPLEKRRTRKLDFFEKIERIRLYKNSIIRSREAKMLSLHIYQLKYPFKNYPFYNRNASHKETKVKNEITSQPIIECMQMNWLENPYVEIDNLHPIFDLSIPSIYRKDAVDARSEIYEEEFNRRIKLEGLRPEHRPNDITIRNIKDKCVND